MNVPVLLTAFNRPRLTRQVIDALRRVRPTRLFVAVDGPRSDRPDDLPAVRGVISSLDAVDWPCQVSTRFREVNLGCGGAMDDGIDWFMEQVGEGIILEDDCVPDATFFPYCQELLERYREDQRVGMISGSNVLGRWQHSTASYHFGRAAVWGWATWQRAWGHSSDHMAGYLAADTRAVARGLLGVRRWRSERVQLELIRRGHLDTWDHPWVYHLASHGQLAIIPAVNLITNVGFAADATHTKTATAGAGLTSQPIKFPLVHPTLIEPDREFDAHWQRLDRRGFLRSTKARLMASPLDHLIR